VAENAAPTKKLVGQDYTTPDLVAKVTGKAKPDTWRTNR